MHKRPWSLIVLAVLNILAPIFNVALNALYMDVGVGSYFTAALSIKYLSLNWPIVFLPLVCGFAIYACKKWSFFVYLVALAGLLFFSYEGYLSKSSDLGVLPLFLVYGVNILAVAFVLIPEVREIYFNPRLRWWEMSPRYLADFDCVFRSKGDEAEKQKGLVGNFSVGGLFLQAEDFPADNSQVSVEFLSNGNKVIFNGRVILHRHQDSVGFGVEFLHSSESKTVAKKICASLEKNGCRIESRFRRPENDTFTAWLYTLLTTGKGLIPTKRS